MPGTTVAVTVAGNNASVDTTATKTYSASDGPGDRTDAGGGSAQRPPPAGTSPGVQATMKGGGADSASTQLKIVIASHPETEAAETVAPVTVRPAAMTDEVTENASNVRPNKQAQEDSAPTTTIVAAPAHKPLQSNSDKGAIGLTRVGTVERDMTGETVGGGDRDVSVVETLTVDQSLVANKEPTPQGISTVGRLDSNNAVAERIDVQTGCSATTVGTGGPVLALHNVPMQAGVASTNGGATSDGRVADSPGSAPALPQGGLRSPAILQGCQHEHERIRAAAGVTLVGAKMASEQGGAPMPPAKRSRPNSPPAVPTEVAQVAIVPEVRPDQGTDPSTRSPSIPNPSVVPSIPGEIQQSSSSVSQTSTGTGGAPGADSGGRVGTIPMEVGGAGATTTAVGKTGPGSSPGNGNGTGIRIVGTVPGKIDALPGTGAGIKSGNGASPGTDMGIKVEEGATAAVSGTWHTRHPGPGPQGCNTLGGMGTPGAGTVPVSGAGGGEMVGAGTTTASVSAAAATGQTGINSFSSGAGRGSGGKGYPSTAGGGVGTTGRSSP
ncbi:unnamed protein product, partial [Choristocarpus tenellus]